MIDRIDAGESSNPRWDSVRDPIGSPVDRYDSTISRRTCRDRVSIAAKVDCEDVFELREPSVSVLIS